MRQGLRHHLEDPADYDGTLAEIEEFFFADEHAEFHPFDAPEAAAPAEDSQVIESAPATAGWYEIVPSDGVFSFRGLCDALGIDLEAARATLRAWADRRLAGSIERLIFDGHHRNLKPRARRARRTIRSSDELLDDTASARAAKVAAMIARRSAGETIGCIAAGMGVTDSVVRRTLAKHLDALPVEVRPKQRSVRDRKKARDSALCRARALGESREAIAARFGLAKPTIATIIGRHARTLRNALAENGITIS